MTNDLTRPWATQGRNRDASILPPWVGLISRAGLAGQLPRPSKELAAEPTTVPANLFVVAAKQQLCSLGLWLLEPEATARDPR